MKTIKIVIPGEMPGLNEIVAAAKSHYAVYAEQKKDNTWLVQLSARNKPKMARVAVTCTWYAKNRRRDPDNISAGVKYILDGIVAAGILKNDGWRQIKSISHTFAVDKHSPRVEVELQDVKQE